MILNSDEGAASATAGTEAQLSVYLNEYQMLTTRNTQWLALQNGVWIIAVAFVGLLLQLLGTLNISIILWLSFIAFEAAVAAYSGIGCESYNNVVYMETTLRPRIRELAGRLDVLRYESFVQRNRPSPQLLFDFGPPAIVTVIFFLAIYFFDLPSPFRAAWFSVMLGLAVINWVLAGRAASIRKRIPVEVDEMATKSVPEPSNESLKNWPGVLMFGLLYPAVLGTFFYSLLPETLQALKAPSQMSSLQGTKLLVSCLLIAHFLIDYYFTQQVALETKRYPTNTFVLDLLIVVALFVAYDSVHLDDNGLLPQVPPEVPEVSWSAGAMCASYVLFRLWGSRMKPVIGRRPALAAYEIGSAAAFLFLATIWPNVYAFAGVLLVSAILMWFIGGPIVEEFHRGQRMEKDGAKG